MLAHSAALLADGQFWSLAALILVGLFLLAYAAFIVAAFISSLASELEIGMKLVWALFIFCAPFLGALCWFLIGRKHAAATALR
ncbi:PLDc N-terminal domain-containing protein [Nocardiopsis composta]|uniref:ABC-type Na+ efflux pump permease subunit n=1 Tax=Nocardiopsis composta TaxID=157465 RepID=A0A7W8QPY5_9ACTN|nr:PLDc N-terminal domain-containing protein [Nocardiopsis composta]MBB5434039.1 ABC-type Na+ efflux pump permease subunit [Nocardiopsis composta]